MTRPRELLGIDVEAEVRLLGRELLHGPWQVPAELVRLAFAAGADEVRLESGRRRWWIRATGAVLDGPDLEAVVVAVDPSRSAEARQQAITRLEQEGTQALLWAAVAAGRVSVTSGDERGWKRAILRAGRGGRVDTGRGTGVEGVEVELRTPSFDPRRARSWLASACRFASRPVALDGVRLPQGVDGGLYRVRLLTPAPGEVVLAAQGRAPSLWLLRHGVLVTRATVPGYPAFHAAVELGALTPPTATPADLRAAVTPLLPGVVDHALELMLWAGRRLGTRPPAVRRRLRTLLLEAANVGLRRTEIDGLPILDVVRGGGDEEAPLLSLAELRRHAEEATTRTVDPDEISPRTGRDDELVLRLSAEERRLVGRLTGVSLERPSARPSGRLGVSLASGLEDILATAAARLRHPLGRRVVSSDRLSASERGLLEALGDPLQGSCRVVVTSGGGPPRWRSRDRRLELPRRGRLMRAAASAVAADPAWWWAVVLAAGAPEDVITEARARWCRGLDRRADGA